MTVSKTISFDENGIAKAILKIEKINEKLEKEKRIDLNYILNKKLNEWVEER